MKRLSITLALLAAMGAQPLAQTAPKLLPFQGHLTDAAGQPVPSGAKLIQFRIYDQPVSGTTVWAGEVHRTTVNEGLVNVLLGTKASLDAIDFNRTLYLEITVDANADDAITAADPPLLPRQVLLPVVFSRESAVSRDSQKLAGYDWSSLLDANDPVNGRLAGAKISPGSIGSNQIAERSILSAHIGLGAIGEAHIADGALKEKHLSDEVISLREIAAEIRNMLVPSGTISAFGGTNVPAGWLPCDGRAVSSADYPELHAAIGTAWGGGYDGEARVGDFNLPDLRGYFLRGMSGANTSRDPDHAARTASNLGGNTGNSIGSIQQDNFRSHTHSYADRYNSSELSDDADDRRVGSDTTTESTRTTAAAGGSETRPKNVYVHYIIKY